MKNRLMKGFRILNTLPYLLRSVQTFKVLIISYIGKGRDMILNRYQKIHVNFYGLYDTIDTLPILIFRELLKTQNLGLLVKKQGLKGKYKFLFPVFESIIEQNEQDIDPNAYRVYKKQVKQIQDLEETIHYCLAGLQLIKYNRLVGFEILEKWGCKKKSIQEISSFINLTYSKLGICKQEFANRYHKLDKKEKNFFDIVANVESQLGYQLNLKEVTVRHWNSIIKSINKKNERENRNNRPKRISRPG